MKKSFITVATVSVVGISSMFLPKASYAETLQQLQNKQVEIQDERSQIKKNLTKAEKEVANLLLDLKELNKEIEQTNKALTANKKEITKTTEDINKTEEEVASLEESIEERFEILKERAVSYQNSGGNIGLLDVIFGSNDFNELISRVTAVTKITESDQQLIDKIDEDKQKVEEKLAELEEIETELKGIQELIVDQKEQNEARKETLKKKEKQLNKKVKKLKMKDSDLAALDKKISQELEQEKQSELVQITKPATAKSNQKSTTAKVVDNSKNKVKNGPKGGLLWPTDGGYISSGIGYRWGSMHKGIDIARTDRSTKPPIYAAESGKVVSANFSNGYGNLVVIDHGNGVVTKYAHMSSISVKAGQSVQRGQMIGKMGSTGNSTGIHLHFEVYINGQLKNPENYLVR